MLGGQLLSGRGHGLGADFGPGDGVAPGTKSKNERTVAWTRRMDALSRYSGKVGGWIITVPIARASTRAASAARSATAPASIVVHRLSPAILSSFGTFGNRAIGCS